MTILHLCGQEAFDWGWRGYVRAFQKRGIRSVRADAAFPPDGDLRELLDRCPERPSLIVQPESMVPLLPWGLSQVDIPTACFQMDTYAYTHRRVRWSTLFDYTIVCHPGFEDQFVAAGCRRLITLPYAVEAELFQDLGGERALEVGFVGHTEATFFATRRRVLAQLSAQFRMNEWWRVHRLEEMAEVYKRSRIGVNISRDDWPQDANLRVFEVMAGGALLVTSQQTELAAFGFQEGVHFAGFSEESDITDIVSYYLSHEPKRREISEAGRQKVLSEHTFDCRVAAILHRLEQDKGKLFAPAREWAEERVRLAYLDCYAAHPACRDAAWRQLLQISRLSIVASLRGSALVARSLAGQARARLGALSYS